jgi:hypothetical protein
VISVLFAPFLLACSSSTPSSVPPEKVKVRRAARAEAAKAKAKAAAKRSGCPVPGTVEVRGTLANSELEEVSGLVQSRQHEVFWVHNDSGDTPRVFAVGPDGSDRGTVTLSGAEAVDWEDMTLIPTEEGPDWLVLGDIGDNREKRTSVQLYRIPEPLPGAARQVDAERMVVRYPGGRAHNAESLFVDPMTDVLYILTKSGSGRSRLMLVGEWTTGEVEARQVAEVQLPEDENPKATAAEVSPDGSWLAIRTYSTIWAYPVLGALPNALEERPCKWDTPREPQGEALAFVEGGIALISEGEGANVHYVPVDWRGE